jgi:hypothetical protein
VLLLVHSISAAPAATGSYWLPVVGYRLRKAGRPWSPMPDWCPCTGRRFRSPVRQPG